MSIFKQQEIVCVFGLGKTGIAAARYLERVGQKFVVIDTRNTPPGAEDIKKLKLCVGSFYGDINKTIWKAELLQVATIILSPGIDPKIELIQAAIRHGKRIVSDIEIFASESSGKIVAITGSNGKSTVTDLTYQLLRASGESVDIGGNFGIPVLDFLPADNSEFYVLELSSFQLDITENLRPFVATILNISEDHMDRYDSFEEYVESKQRIYRSAKKCLANLDDRLTIPTVQKNFCSFSLEDEKADYYLGKLEGKRFLNHKEQPLVSVDDLSLSGRHNWSNALAALGILSELEIKIDKNVIETLKKYKGLPHRFEKVSLDSKVDWINDSKATNVGATIAAIDSIDRDYYSPVVLIAGGESKGADLSPLTESLSNKVDVLYLLGKDADKIADLAKDKSQIVGSMKEAVELSDRFVKSNSSETRKGVVLLSPACASLDMYPNFEERGNNFRECVEALQ